MYFYSPIDSSPSTKPLLLAMTRRTQGSMQLHGLFCGILSTLMSLHYNDSVYYPPPHPSPSSIINTRCARRLLFIVGSSWRSQLSLSQVNTLWNREMVNQKYGRNFTWSAMRREKSCRMHLVWRVRTLWRTHNHQWPDPWPHLKIVLRGWDHA